MIRTRKSRLARFIAISALLFTAVARLGPSSKGRLLRMSVAIHQPRFRPPAARPTLPVEKRNSFVEGRDIPGEWWTLFHSKPLNDLIERSLKANPDLKAAQAALVVARENVLAQRGAYYPSVTGGFSATLRRHPVTFHL